jgi:hypothetical protein
MKSRSFSLALLVGAVVGSAACSDDVEIGENSQLPAATGGSAGSGGAVGSGGSSGSLQCIQRNCGSRLLACGDCDDNDKDGLIDAADSECLGACDDTEDSFNGGMVGNNTPCRLDCYFDSDSGSGNDGCYWSHRCDSLSLAPDFPPSADSRCAYDAGEMIPGAPASCDDLESSQSEMCREICGPLTPNGCDCFGCCEVPSGSQRFVWIGSTDNGVASCDRAHVDDPTKCRPCTPVMGCFNPCDQCEVCVGHSANDPSSCSAVDSGPAPRQCAPGVQACGREGQPLCGPNQYCVTGCCITVPA